VNPVQIAADYGISVEEVRARWMMLRVARWKADFRLFAREVVKIRAKDGELVPLILNEAQEMLLEAGEQHLRDEQWIRLLGLKGRRQGFSTMVAARGYWRATLWDRQKVYIQSHEMTSSGVLFDMVDLMQQKHPFPPAVGRDNAKELEFVQRGSAYTVATAGQKAGGRGGGISFFHGSEVAWWTNAADHFSASVQAVDEVRGRRDVLWRRPARPLPFEAKMPLQIEGWARAPSEIWMETTSAGPTGVFHEKYMDAMKSVGRYRHVFIPWTVQKEYIEDGDFVPSTVVEDEGELSEADYQETYGLSDGQMLWRRSKLHELGSPGKFRQEYPVDITEAFSAADIDGIFIKPALILQARKRRMEDPDAPLIVGVDPAGAGGDRFAVTWRRGDKVVRQECRHHVEHEEAVEWLCQIIDNDKPNRMNIDNGSMGRNILSSVRSRGPQYGSVIRGIDFAGKSGAKQAQPNRSGPWNRRAEMWGRMREWLVQGGCIPDDEDLASDLAGPKTKYRANGDWLLESKTDMKARGVRSPDKGDSAALTFASQEFFEDWKKPEVSTGFSTGKDVQHVPSTYFSGNSGGGSRNGWMR